MPNLAVHDTIYNLAKSIENLEELRQKIGALHIDALNNGIPAHTAAGRLAMEGNHRAVQLLEQLGASPLGIVRGYASRRLQKNELMENQKILTRYLDKYPRFRFQIIWAYAANGLTFLAEELLNKFSDTINTLLTGYAYANNQQQIARYRNMLNKDQRVKALALGYTSGGHEFALSVEDAANPQIITNKAIGCIMRGDLASVTNEIKQHLLTDHYMITLLAQLGYDELVTEHELIDEQAANCSILQSDRIEAIILGYLYANHWAKVEEYRNKYSMSPEVMDVLYQKAYERCGIKKPTAALPKPEQPSVQPIILNIGEVDDLILNKTKEKLLGLGKLPICNQLIQSLDRLKQGQDNFWNPYWIGSREKLSKIIVALQPINTIENLIKSISDKQSQLYEALNTQRLLPITFLGHFGHNQAKTLINTQEQLPQKNM